MRLHLSCGVILLVCMTSGLHAESKRLEVPEDFPRFSVPNHDREMELLRELFWLHARPPAGPLATLWDEWMAISTLWPAHVRDNDPDQMRKRWHNALSNRRMDVDGYVSTHQHDGTAHSEGWPFPLWHQGKGHGWHFVGTGIAGYDTTPATPEGWTLQRARAGDVIDTGWRIDLVEAGATAQSPAMSVGVRHAPFIRINWRATGMAHANPYLEWTSDEHPEFSPERRIYFSAPKDEQYETRTNIPMHRLPSWEGTITGLRINFGNAPGAAVTIKSIHTAYDTRHNINNSNFIRASQIYFYWTRDFAFLRSNIGRVRKAMHYNISEFQTRDRKLVFTPWVGHEGRTGIHRAEDGTKTLLHGEGIGNNYWDLLPFGGEDCLATIYYYDAVLKLADLEEQIAANPQWNVPAGPDAFDADDLRRHAREVKDHASRRFWNPRTQRFVAAIDTDGRAWDYGLTFLNCEAIYYGLASDEQASAIMDWLDGRRIVEGDTSQGSDIYHWRFAARSTTLRNIEYYFWGWSNPEHLAWGDQVQDGGAVLGFSYHDLMARLRVLGPDNAWNRLREIVQWFDEVQSEGGYREYYKVPGRGTLQGGNIPGGLGMDREFFESILVPQVMLYGFLGFEPRPDGFAINPNLPESWPEMTITRIRLHEWVLDVRVDRDTIEITDHSRSSSHPAVTLTGDRKIVFK